jgi:hypothetical protein
LLVNFHLSFSPVIAISFPFQVLQLNTSGVVSKVESTCFHFLLINILIPIMAVVFHFIFLLAYINYTK